MKIVYHGQFRPHYRTERWVAEALTSLGVEVVRVSSSKDIFSVLEGEKPDVLLYSKGQDILDMRRLLNYCRDNDILSVCWLYDLYWDFQRRFTTRDAIFDADVVVTTDGGHDENWERNGINHYVVRQGIFEPEAKLGEAHDTKVEIAFVGCNNPWWQERKMLMLHLEKRYGNKFKWYGREKQIRGKELNNLFASVKVIVGDSVYSPNYWSNRVYETLGRGGFLLHQRTPGLEKEFEYYKHLVPYDCGDHEQVCDIIDYYLEHDEKREEIRLAGHEYCKEHYTYKNSCKKLLKIINEERENIRGKDRDRGGRDVSSRPKNEVASGEESPSRERKSRADNSCSRQADKREEEFPRVPKDREKVTTILLNYSRPENYHDLIENLRGQKDVDMDIWIWDSGHNLPELEDVKVFSDPVNPGLFVRWEVARFVKEGYVLFIDDDVLPLDDRVVIDTIRKQQEFPIDTVVGWKGVRIMGGHNESQHVHSKHVKNDFGVHFCKGNYMLFHPATLPDTKPFPREISKIDPKAHGEFWYQLQMGGYNTNHRVVKCLEGRLSNEFHHRRGLEFRKGHYDNQAKHLEYCIDKLC